MNGAYVAAALRTPIGRYGGALARVRPDDLAAHIIRALITRTGIDPAAVDDVIWGAANQSGEDCRNVARFAALIAGLPVSVPGTTVNRLCASGLEAINSAAQAVIAGGLDLVIAGGSESMTRAPYVQPKSDDPYGRAPQIFDTTLGMRMTNPAFAALHSPVSLGETAEIVADRYAITREEQDVFALRSQRNAAAAIEAGAFDAEIVAIEAVHEKATALVTRDESPRPETTLESLARLRPAFRPGGTVTAGNSSPLNDGAAALLICSEAALHRYALVPLARVVAWSAAGVDPSVMGLGPIPATRKLLARTGLRPRDLDLVELNEAFASQAIACIRELEFPPERVNVNGGAIALGHPLGCSGARIATTLIHALRTRGANRGLATMCIGIGQGLSTLFELPRGF